MDNIGLGDAPCGCCKLHIYRIPILLDTQESDGNGGHWWQVAPGQSCPLCGEPLRWYHKSSSPIARLLSSPVAATADLVLQEATDD
jgi:hypothetical protein